MFGPSKQSRLNRRLLRAARKGDVAVIEQVLKDGAALDARSGRFEMDALAVASLNGQLDAVKLLVAKGADIETLDDVNETSLLTALLRKHMHVAEFLIEQGADTTIIGFKGRTALSLARDAGTAGRKIVRQLTQTPEVPRTETPDEIVFFRTLGNRTMEETFDFSARERITLLRKGKNGPVEAMTRESFASIGDKSSLQRAFDEHIKKGGTTKETDIFSTDLSKIKKPQGRQI